MCERTDENCTLFKDADINLFYPVKKTQKPACRRQKTGMVTIQAVLIFFIPEKMTEHPSSAESAEIFKFDFLLLLKGIVNKNNII